MQQRLFQEPGGGQRNGPSRLIHHQNLAACHGAAGGSSDVEQLPNLHPQLRRPAMNNIRRKPNRSGLRQSGLSSVPSHGSTENLFPSIFNQEQLEAAPVRSLLAGSRGRLPPTDSKTSGRANSAIRSQLFRNYGAAAIERAAKRRVPLPKPWADECSLLWPKPNIKHWFCVRFDAERTGGTPPSKYFTL